MPKEPIIAHDQSEKVPVDQINLLKNYLHQGSVKAAIEQINTLMEQFPRDIRLFNLLAISYEKLGHYLSLEKIDLKKTDKIVNLIHLMLENVDQIKNMMSFSNIKLRNVKENYIKNLKNKI